MVLSERAGDGGPRFEFARDKKEMQGRVATATGEAGELCPIQRMSFADWPKGLLWGVLVHVGLYGQRSETRETAGLSPVEAESPLTPDKRRKHLCFPCARQQTGNEAVPVALNGDSASSQGPTKSKSRNRAHARLISSRLICGFICTC